MKLINLLLFLILSSIAVADEGIIETYKPNENFDLTIHLTNSSGEVVGANCSTQIRFKNLSIKDELKHNEINGGLYNLTYNTTKIGKYFCRTNCTLGVSYAAETCDFIIGIGDDNMLGFIIIIPMLIAIFLLVASRFLSERLWPLKMFLLLAGFVFVFESYRFSTILFAEFYGTSNLIDAIGDSTFYIGMIWVIIISVFLLTFLYDLFQYMAQRKKKKTGDYND